jgi:hypothetical protein
MYRRIRSVFDLGNCISIITYICFQQVAFALSVHSPTRVGLPISSYSNSLLRSISHELEDFTNENDGPSMTRSAGTELWLDLRSTAIHPKAAMDYLESQLGSTTHFVDRILLSEEMFQNLVDYSDLYLRATRILYHNSENDSILSSTGDGLSIPFGSFLPFPTNAAVVVDDPIQAIQIISGGKWLVLGNEGENVDYEQESKRLDGVRNFMEIACTASGAGAWGASVDSRGLVLPTSPSGAKGDVSSYGVGGVAIKCYSTSALMKLASAIHLMRPGLMTSVTNSGIVIQNTDDPPPSLSTAIILPFDVEMWEASILVFPKEDIVNLKEYQ